ncbi:response regulator [Massilia glaciei]|uniref:response regulator n=1 Tax=Massilia glaciei TaxID=1524097 RepID=UPI00351D1A9E
MGLSLVKSLVNLHGGRVRARSDGPDLGSTFTVILPLQLAAPDGAALASHASQAQAAGKRALRIQVVDDNVDAARMLCLLLEADGHAVSVEHDPVAVLRGADSAPMDVYLLDIGLPGMDGNTLARALRSSPGAAQATLIAVTGYGQKYDRESTLAAGFDHYFIKPANPDQLVGLLANIAPSAAASLTTA